MQIKKILIVDHNEGEAGEYIFSPNANLLVSKDNSQGKSSLLKSMYYALGLDIKRFPAKWNPSKMTIKLDLYNERTDKSIYVVRRGDVFNVSGIDESIDVSEYTRWLSAELGVDMKLTHRTTKITNSITRPSALITPFYIDQDESWSGRLYSSINEVSMYADTPKRIIDYILNISDDDELKMREDISILQGRKNDALLKRKNVNDVYMDYLNDEVEPSVENISSITNPIENNKQSIDEFIVLMDKLNKIYIEHKASRIKTQRDIDQKRKSAEEYRSILKMYKTDYNAIKSICKHCKSELTKEQINTRMEISTNIYELSYLLDSTELEIRNLEDKLKEKTTEEGNANEEYKKISEKINSNLAIKSIAEYIDDISKKKSQDEFASIIQKLDANLGSLTAQLKELQKELRSSQKESKALVNKIKHSYADYVTELSAIMKGSNVTNIEFEDFKAPKSSGVNDNQAYLGAYLAYIRLIAEYGRYKFTFCIDSFIKNETADVRQDDMFAATDKYLMNIKGQSIFSAIESSVERFMPNHSKYNRVNIGERLLSSDNYQKVLKEIKQIVAI